MFTFSKINVCLLSVFCSLIARTNSMEMEPGQCLSRFDFDYKILQKLLELESNIKELKDKIAKCQEREPMSLQLAGRAPTAFMATLTAHIPEPQDGSTVVFDSVITNEGNAYSPVTGVFAANVGGTYNFQLTATSPTVTTDLRSRLHIYLMKNSEKIGYVFLDDNNDRWLQRSIAVVVHLDHGDKVFVKVGSSGGSTLAGCCMHTHFSGFLIHKD